MGTWIIQRHGVQVHVILAKLHLCGEEKLSPRLVLDFKGENKQVLGPTVSFMQFAICVDKDARFNVPIQRQAPQYDHRHIAAFSTSPDSIALS